MTKEYNKHTKNKKIKKHTNDKQKNIQHMKNHNTQKEKPYRKKEKQYSADNSPTTVSHLEQNLASEFK